MWMECLTAHLLTTEKGATLLSFYSQTQSVGIDKKSLHGRGGMDSKISAAQSTSILGSQVRECMMLSGADLDG